MVFGLLKSKLGGGKTLSDKGTLSPQTLEVPHFTTANVALVAGKENIIGEMSINPQTRMFLGYGTAEQPYNQGNVYMNLKDTASAELEGEVILSISDFNGNNNKVVYRGHLFDLRSGLSDITKRIKFPMNAQDANQYDKIVLKFVPKSVGNGTLSATASQAFIASSVQYLGNL